MKPLGHCVRTFYGKAHISPFLRRTIAIIAFNITKIELYMYYSGPAFLSPPSASALL